MREFGSKKKKRSAEKKKITRENDSRSTYPSNFAHERTKAGTTAQESTYKTKYDKRGDFSPCTMGEFTLKAKNEMDPLSPIGLN